MKRVLNYILLGLAILIGTVAIGGWLLLRWLNFFPPPEMPAEVTCDTERKEPPHPLEVGKKFRVLSWNIQYSASRKYKFFYDGGKDVYPKREDVEATIKKIAKVIDKEKPDVVLLQEVDRGSDRTYRIDQLMKLWNKERYPCWSSTPYHRTEYLPYPYYKPLKRVDMHLVIFSRYPIIKSIRHSLPLLRENFIRQAFNLKRAVLETEVQMSDGKSFTFLNTHLSAFSYNDGTLGRQIEKIVKLLLKLDGEGKPWLLAGDFNMLPPGDDPKRLGEEAIKSYPKPDSTPISKLFETWLSALPLAEYRKSPEIYNTYLPFGAKKADRWIDYIFHSHNLETVSYRVLREYSQISDHLPLLAEFIVKKQKSAKKANIKGEK